MRRRFLLFGVIVGGITLGLAGFAANTAQWVNVTAHVEKEIETACVNGDARGATLDGDGNCAFGTVFPQDVVTKYIEVTASKSFLTNDTYSSVNYDVYWECKLVDETALADPYTLVTDNDPAGPSANDEVTDGTNPCRNDPYYAIFGEEDFGSDTFATAYPLTGNIRDYIDVGANTTCLDPTDAGVVETDKGVNAQLYYQGAGSVDNADGQKCFYTLDFTVPYCNGHMNPNTEPATAPADVQGVDCVFDNADSSDPQDWEHYADLGDVFKIQVESWNAIQ
jgi:hypothetical protein